MDLFEENAEAARALNIEPNLTRELKKGMLRSQMNMPQQTIIISEDDQRDGDAVRCHLRARGSD